MRSRGRLLSSLGCAGFAGLALSACFTRPGGALSGIADASPVDASLDAAAADVGWDHPRVPYDGGALPTVPRKAVGAEFVSTFVDTEQLLFAASEMQISGEPFAETFAGRDLSKYDRKLRPVDQYIIDPDPGHPRTVTDLFGFSTAVESYEYSKYHMNMIAQETGAGVSLLNGPLIAQYPVAGVETPTPFQRLRERMGLLMAASGSNTVGYSTVPPPEDNPLNTLGFPGLRPTLAAYKTFDPSIEPTHEVVNSCTVSGGYGGIPLPGATVPEYECAYYYLRLLNLPAQSDRLISPSTIGFATWKEALWSIDFVSRLHDADDRTVDTIDPADGAQIGVPGNVVIGNDSADPTRLPRRGTFLGSQAIEGMWGLIMIDEMENAADWLTRGLLTTDGAALGGFDTTAAALSYDYDAKLRWFPSAVRVQDDDGKGTDYRTTTALSIVDASSRVTHLSALLLGYAMFFAMTDARNAAIGQAQGLALTFDGAPMAADNGLPDGEKTAHDRALAVLRVAFVDLDRIHTHKTLGVLIDDADIRDGQANTGAKISVDAMGHALMALRQTLLSVNAAITQYGGADPSPDADEGGILNAFPIHPALGNISGDGGDGPTFSARVRQLLQQNAAFVLDRMTDAQGHVVASMVVDGNEARPSGVEAQLQDQAAAIRALLEGFAVTGDARYQERARAVARRLEAAFYDPALRMYRDAEGGSDIVMTPAKFAWLQSALRETYKVAHVPGDAQLDRTVLEDRIARINKLFLNGWDDLDGDTKIDADKTECLAARLQMGEQYLTGELGRDDQLQDTSDGDNDCVPEIDNGGRASLLASQVRFFAR